MLELFSYSFIRRAILVSLFLSICMPLIGIVIVNKNLSVLGDALSHTSLAGVVLGLVLGINPAITAVLLCIGAGLLIEYLRDKFPGHESISTTVIMSASVGLAGILSDFTKGASNFESYLFGSIVAISKDEVLMILAATFVILFISSYYYRELQYISFHEVGAKVSGINVKFINRIFSVLTAITIAVASKAIGVLIVASMLVIPVACAIKLKLSYFRTVIFSIIFSFIFMSTGVVISYYLDIKPGGTTVIIATITLMLIIFFKNFFNRK